MDGTTEHLIDEAIRGYLLERHIPFDQLDAWTDDLMDIVREHLEPELHDG